MARSTKEKLLGQPDSTSGSLIDKTTRLAWEIVDAETREREERTARLRKTRLKREAATPQEEPKTGRKSRGK
jgi:hypothetical protein